ncbi:hypothetical protein NKJ87_02385 [Mesorhizobium sp. M0027]|uniref:hypothetical protein n=1 Tax=Mesorhizobium sp. M0027 TaxID=2956848 RepID=UPI00333A7D54
MSQWQIFRKIEGKDVADVEQFDDGIWAGPGDDGFTADHVIAEMKARGASGYSYIGRSTKVGERTQADIVPRVAAVAEELRAKVMRDKTAEIVSAIPKGKKRLVSDIEAEVARHLQQSEHEITAAARSIALRNMGLAE